MTEKLHDFNENLEYFYKKKDNLSFITKYYDEFRLNTFPEDKIEVVLQLNHRQDDFYETLEAEYQRGIENSESVESFLENLKDYRQKQKAFHSEQNSVFIDNNQIQEKSEDYELFVSHYSPYIVMLFKSISIYEIYRKQIEKLARAEDILRITVSVPQEDIDTAERQVSALAENYSVSQILKDINAESQTYTGKGLNIAVWEASSIAFPSSHPELANLTIYHHGVNLTEGSHAINVIRTLCGSRGIARGIKTVYNFRTNGSSYVTGMNWTLDNNCVVISASIGVKDSAGMYIWRDGFMDYHVRYSKISFVTSAGNEGNNDNPGVTPPAVGFNSITVASCNNNNAIAYNSSYGIDESIYGRKPTLCAPGVKIETANYGSGTSYACPVVAGVVLKLIEEFFYAFTPETMISALCASATPVLGQVNDWDVDAGYGRINYERARESCRFPSSIRFLEDTTAGVRGEAEVRFIEPREKIRYVVTWLSNSTTNSTSSSANQNDIVPLNVYLYREYGSAPLASDTEKGNVKCLVGTLPSTDNRLLIRLNSATPVYVKDLVGKVAWSVVSE